MFFLWNFRQTPRRKIFSHKICLRKGVYFQKVCLVHLILSTTKTTTKNRSHGGGMDGVLIDLSSKLNTHQSLSLLKCGEYFISNSEYIRSVRISKITKQKAALGHWAHYLEHYNRHIHWAYRSLDKPARIQRLSLGHNFCVDIIEHLNTCIVITSDLRRDPVKSEFTLSRSFG